MSSSNATSPAEVRSCRPGDARCAAAARIRSASGEVVYAYGTHDEMLVAFGVREAVATDDWRDLDAFLSRNERDHVFGHVGFDMHYGRPQAADTAVHFVVPREVLRVRAGTAAPACACGRPPTASDESSGHDAYRAAVRATLDWIGGDDDRRLTVARRVECVQPADPLDGLGRGPKGPGWVRSFYVRTPGVDFAGHSPELLAQGNRRAFRTGKLSGTYPRSPDPAEDEALRARFEDDGKIHHEHESSVASTIAALERVGDVTRLSTGVLDLPGLRHRITTLETRPPPGAGVADCLRAVLPSGARPADDGLALLRRLEPRARGAYYGLVGVVRPGGGLSFSQVLRTTFRDPTGTYCWVGAAITRHSDPDRELAETVLKLSSALYR